MGETLRIAGTEDLMGAYLNRAPVLVDGETVTIDRIAHDLSEEKWHRYTFFFSNGRTVTFEWGNGRKS